MKLPEGGKENVFRQHSSEALTKPEGNDCRKTQRRRPGWADGVALSSVMSFPSYIRRQISEERHPTRRADEIVPEVYPKGEKGATDHFRPWPAKAFQKVFAAIRDFLRGIFVWGGWPRQAAIHGAVYPDG